MDNGKPLSSWKEISAYLGCDERTCLRWEKGLGLPIHRIGSPDSKGHVFAYKEELDEWLRARREQQAGTPQRRAAKMPSDRKRLLFLLGSLAVGLALVFVAFKLIAPRPRSREAQPFDFRIERSFLVILNDSGRELWRHDTKCEDLRDERFFREHFQVSSEGDENLTRRHPLLLIKDVNDDGWSEVIMSPLARNDRRPGQILFFDHRGHRLWEYESRREMKFGQKKHTANYAISGVDIIPAAPGRARRLLVIARNLPDWPSYAAVLSLDGKLISEFWNAGRITDYAFDTQDGNSRPRILLTGTNNEYCRGFLAAFDLESFGGASPNSGEYSPADHRLGMETHYLLFPRTKVDEVEFPDRELIGQIDLLGPNEIQLIAFYSRIIFILDGSFGVKRAIVGDEFKRKYRRYQKSGKIPPGSLDEATLSQELAQGVVYWDGMTWSLLPAMNKRPPGPTEGSSTGY